MRRRNYRYTPTQKCELHRHTPTRFDQPCRHRSVAPQAPGSRDCGERFMTALKYKNGRHLLKRQYVRLKGWLTLGSIGIMPRLIIAFASVSALAATANLIVENGVAILEQQRTVAMERSALDGQQIIALRESMG